MKKVKMNKFKDVLGFLIVSTIILYSLFGNPKCPYWSFVYFACENSIVIYLTWIIMTGFTSFSRIVVCALCSISAVKLSFDILRLVDRELFIAYNNSQIAGFFVVSAVVVCLVLESIVWKKNLKH